MTRRVQYFAAYQQAIKNLESKFPSLEDEMIVALWTSVQALQTTVTEQSLKLSLLESHETSEVNEASTLLDSFRVSIMPPAVKPKPTTQGE